jgi:signal transduction histidine kinase/CheY-like chemotaxis protein
MKFNIPDDDSQSSISEAEAGKARAATLSGDGMSTTGSTAFGGTCGSCVSVNALLRSLDRRLYVHGDSRSLRMQKVTVTFMALVMSLLSTMMLIVLSNGGVAFGSARWVVMALLVVCCLSISAGMLLTRSKRLTMAGGHCIMFGVMVVMGTSTLSTGIRVVEADGTVLNAAVYIVAACFSSMAAFIYRSKMVTFLWGFVPIAALWIIFGITGARPGDADFGPTLVNLCALSGATLMNTLCLAYFSAAADTLTTRAADAKSRMKDAMRDAIIERNANAAKTRFVSVMSHEIRNPLQAVLLQIEMLESTKLTLHQLDYVKGIGRASQVLLAIVNDVLDVTKIESGAIALESADFNVREACEFTLQTVAPSASQKGIALFLSMEPTLDPWVRGDVTRFRQILHNLLGNALKFTSEGEVELTVTRASEPASPSRPDSYMWDFAVRDTGIGISPEGQQKLFLEFSQVDESTTREFGGTGLGLFICKQLSELMGGGVAVEAELGVGSTFHSSITLDAANDDDSSLDRSEPVSIASSTLKWRCYMYGSNAQFVESCLEYVRYFFAAADNATILPLHDAKTVASDLLGALTDRDDDPANTRVILLVDRASTDTADEASMVRNILALAAEHPRLFTPILVSHDPSAAVREGYLAEGWKHMAYKPVMLAQLCTTLANAIDLDHAGNVDLELATPRFSTPESSKGSKNPRSANPAYSSGMQTLTRGKRLPAFDADAAAAAAGVDAPLILIVDDFQLVRDLVRQVIASLGYRTEIAANGSEAVTAIRAGYERFSMILMDCEMPVMDGYTATEGIREYEESIAVPKALRIPVCAMTANAMREDVQKCLQRGMDDFLSKPVKRADLKNKLESWARKVRRDASGELIKGSPLRAAVSSAGLSKTSHHTSKSKRRKALKADPGDRRSMNLSPPRVPEGP